jgi:predicted MPP superfamily phosphohydrolase
LYDPLAAAPDYILVGNFNALTGAYTATVQEHAELVASFGVYQLFQVHDQITQPLQ